MSYARAAWLVIDQTSHAGNPIESGGVESLHPRRNTTRRLLTPLMQLLRIVPLHTGYVSRCAGAEW